jgi:hypothetical protein
VTPSDIPHAETLRIDADPSGNWIVFHFKVGDQDALITMDADKLGDALYAVVNAINIPVVAARRAEVVPSGTLYTPDVIYPTAYGADVAPLGGKVTANFDLPGAIRMRFALTLQDSEQLQLALRVAGQKAVAVDEGTKH